MSTSFAIGSLVQARGRAWVVLPSADEDLLMLRPVGGGDDETTGLCLPLERDDVEHVMDSFPIVRRKDEKAYGEGRTKRHILEVYDAMAVAARTGVPNETLLDPPPAHDSMRHPAREGAPR